MIWDYGSGNFSVDEGTRYADKSPGAISQDAPGNDWLVPWTAPSEDIGDLQFSLAGNIVDGNGQANSNDKWNTLAFTISAPGTVTVDEDESLRTISVGDYDSLFGQKSAEEIEMEKQQAAARKTRPVERFAEDQVIEPVSSTSTTSSGRPVGSPPPAKKTRSPRTVTLMPPRATGRLIWDQLSVVVS